jgi:hypothetical protein
MNEIWFHADTPWGKSARVFDGDGKQLVLVRSYELMSRTAVILAVNGKKADGTYKLVIKDGKAVTETKQLPDSYLVVGGVRY